MHSKQSTGQCRVRFAPSPTGYFHIGSARTALFNWLFARNHNGKFLLRIEDTDRERSSQEYLDSILDSLLWLGLQWDDDIFIQSRTLDDHKAAVDKLLKKQAAYKCYCTPEGLDKKRKEANRKKIPYKYDRACCHLTAEEAESFEKGGTTYAVRCLIPEGITEFVDTVHGKTVFRNGDIDDFIILRENGTPTYQLAAVVDDHHMRITNVIRGDDHLSNTPKQIILYESLGWTVPEFAHMPMILGNDKTRLSKRHGAASVEVYKERGYLPEALRNFLLLLGWSPGDDREIIGIEEAIKSFGLGKTSKNSAVFDEKKLEWMNSLYISALSDGDLAEHLKPFIARDQQLENEVHVLGDDYLKKVLALVKSRMKLLTDFLIFGGYFYRDPEDYAPKAVNKHWMVDDVMERLGRLRLGMMDMDDFSERKLEESIRGLAEKLGLSAGQLIHPVRLALTGFGISPGLFEVMNILGKDTVIRRLDKAIRYLNRV